MSKQTISPDIFAQKLSESRSRVADTLLDRPLSHAFLYEVLQLLFPHFSKGNLGSPAEILREMRLLEATLVRLLGPLQARIELEVEDVADSFVKNLPRLYEMLLLDAQAIYNGDPAADSVDEVILAYPGFFAISVYRLAHEFYRMRIPILPRVFTEHAHERTGIDIHPGATIGESFFIDHGTGIVVGETTLIKNNVKLYQGVTLGALSVSKSKANTKRHPTIEDNVVIYSNATILGGETVIGHDCVIGGNVWITESVEPFSMVYHKSEVKMRKAPAAAKPRATKKAPARKK